MARIRECFPKNPAHSVSSDVCWLWKLRMDAAVSKNEAQCPGILTNGLVTRRQVGVR